METYQKILTKLYLLLLLLIFFIPFAFTGGAPRKGEGLSKQLVVTEDEDVVYHKLPGGKRKRTTVVHDLMAAVNSGKRPAKKH